MLALRRARRRSIANPGLPQGPRRVEEDDLHLGGEVPVEEEAGNLTGEATVVIMVAVITEAIMGHGIIRITNRMGFKLSSLGEQQGLIRLVEDNNNNSY